MVKRLNKPIGGHDNYVEIVEKADEKPTATAVVKYEYLISVINDALATKNTLINKKNAMVQFEIIDNRILGIKFNTGQYIYPRGKEQIYAIASNLTEIFKNEPYSKTSELEVELRNEIAKLAKEVYRMKKQTKPTKDGIEELEGQIRGLYAKVAVSGV